MFRNYMFDALATVTVSRAAQFRLLQLLTVACVAVALIVGWIDPATAGVAFIGMAAPADYLDANDLKNVLAGGMVKEEVQQKIFDCSEIPTPFLDMVREGACSNSYTEWTEDELENPDIANAAVSGADADALATDAGNLARRGNHTQICVKTVKVTERAGNVATHSIGDTMAYKTMRKMQALRRDVEAIAVGRQASVQDDNNVTAGKSAGLGAWIVTNDSHGAGGSATGFNTGTKLVAAPVVGARRALTWVLLSDQIEAVYVKGGNPTVVMSNAGLCKRLARFLFTTAYAATPTANVNGSGEGVTQTSQGYIDTFRTDFGFTMKIVPNRLQQTYNDSGAAAAVDVYGLDLDYLEVGYLHTYKVDPLAKLGLSNRRLLSVDWTLRVNLERGLFDVRDINPTADVTA